MENGTTAHALYRFFGEDGELLYVGITNNPSRRWAEHEKSKPWWHEVINVDLERYATREEVLAAEAEAIRAERPKYNLTHLPVAAPEVQPKILCEMCPAEATTASVIGEHLRRHHLYRREHEREVHENGGWVIRSGSELLREDIPWPAHWYITCDEHYPGDDAVSYWLQLHRGRRSFVDMLRHVAEKDWAMKDTQIIEFAVRLLAPLEAPLPRGKAW